MITASADTATSAEFSNSVSRPVYSSSQMIFTGSIISPLGAAYMIAHDLRQFGKPAMARNVWIFGVFTLILFLAATVILPGDLRYLAFIINGIFAITATIFTAKTQVTGAKDHLARGGKLFSGWNCLAVSIISFLLAIVCMLPLVPVYHYFHRLP